MARAHPPLAALALAALFTCALPAGAAEVEDATPHRRSGWLVVDLRLRDLLDERTRSTVESGLPGSCLVEVELRATSDGVRVRRAFERSLELDLWDDVVRLIEGERWRSFDSLAAADSAWSRWEDMPLVPWTEIEPERHYQLRVSVWVEPLGAEERERISRWVSRGERGDERELTVDLGGLVRRFFGSTGRAADAHVWTGPPFSPASLGSDEGEGQP